MAIWAFLCGICATQWVPVLPAMPWAVALLMTGIAGVAISSRSCNSILKLFCIFLIGFAYMCGHVDWHKAKQLPKYLDNQKIVLSGTVINMPEAAKFVLKIHKTEHWPNPGNVQVHWENVSQKLKPGTEWQLFVKLKSPRNFANPGSFDTEKLFFQQRLVATGYVINSPFNQLIKTKPYAEIINQIRYYILNYMSSNLSEKSFIGIIVALVLGTKVLLPSEQWQVLQDTGTAHLMAISGMHIGLIASLMFLGLRLAWRFAPAAWLNIPAPWLAAWGALSMSIVYALLAGFSVSTQRALIMIIVFLSGIILRRKVSAWQKYNLALLLVLLWDPFVVLSVGFWLSFLAVGSLLYVFTGKKSQRWFQSQLVITVSLLPVSLLFFGKTALVAPLANFIAIPWVTFLVVPLSLLGTLCLLINNNLSLSLLKLAEYNFAHLWPFLEWCSKFAVFNWQPPGNYFWLRIACAAVGVIWLFVPKGLPGRWWAILAFLPLFIFPLNVIPHGQADFTLLDVGQGLAAVVRTQNHVLVYDTGARLNKNFDLGSKVVVPYLHSLGLHSVDKLLISHADNDHIGGAESILAQTKVSEIIISDTNYLAAYNPQRCMAGQHWEWDGVKFIVLHPSVDLVTRKRNDYSCVLMVQAGKHKLLLTGDIETKSEKILLANYGEYLKADILLVPHHGSKTSSSLAFIEQVKPGYALIPVGYKNQYGHPKPQILQRYQDLNIPVLRTELDGAISFKLGSAQLKKPGCYRRDRRKFWLANN